MLYIPKNDYDKVAEIVCEIHPRLIDEIEPGSPAFTRRLADGISMAENPLQGESFGLHRCGLLASGLIKAYERGKASLNARMRAIGEVFAGANLDLERPYLNPGSSDLYRCESRAGTKTRTAFPPAHDSPDKEGWLRTAHEIGINLWQAAIWQDTRCNWLGAELDTDNVNSEVTRQAYRTLGPYLYSGTSGIALFLAELYSATGDTVVRRAALGAIRQALARIGDVPPTAFLGLYQGRIGIAFALARVGSVLGEEEFIKLAGQSVTTSVGNDLQGEHESDLMAGNAGAILALLALSEMLPDRALTVPAMHLGDELLQRAEKTETGCSWRATALPHRHNLTGFSHGAAGIGYALLELYLATKETKYRETAEAAFRYERQWFDADACNWRDFRAESGRDRRLKRPYSFASAWCHGAPGIALSRIRAYEVLDNDVYRSEAASALQTTYETLERSLTLDNGNYSLCHGLAGNAEVLLHGQQVLGRDGRKENLAIVLLHEVARIGAFKYGGRSQKWPCGTGGGETPNVMLGLAGIGYFYLRLYDQTIPSLIMLRPKSFCSM